MPRIYKYMDVESRLENNSVRITECGCQIWMGAFTTMGYGKLSVNGTDQYVHRASYELSKGKIPFGMNVLHRCDIPTCINPDHLFIGTHADNVADKIAKNRQPRGEKVGGSKLTDQDVIAIRASDVGVNELARRMNLSPMTISLIRNRKIWKHI